MNDIIKKYIKDLKKRIYKIIEELPEFWAQEELREIQVLYRTVGELKSLIGDSSEDEDMKEIKDWLKGHSRSV